VNHHSEDTESEVDIDADINQNEMVEIP